jgi:hypothetical protein
MPVQRGRGHPEHLGSVADGQGLANDGLYGRDVARNAPVGAQAADAIDGEWQASGQ